MSVTETWKETAYHISVVCADREPLGRSMGWSFWEHPFKGDEGHVLAVSLNHIGANGPVVYDTGEYEVPEYL